MALTRGPGGRWLGPPSGLVPKLTALAERIAARTAELGAAVEVDPLVLLAERAAIWSFPPGGEISCGGGTHLLPTADGRWLAVTLARPDDEEMMPAWLEIDVSGRDPWPTVATALAGRTATELMDRAVLLGLPVGALPRHPPTLADPVRRTRLDDPSAPPALRHLLVIDLSSLWAGPLCGSLLAQAGATVVKVESTRRPDGARGGPAAFFDLLNAGKRSVALDLTHPAGLEDLRRLISAADVVIEASRPRALRQLGIDADALLTTGRPRVWASITGYGRDGVDGDRVAFGDDAAVAGGLVTSDGRRPLLCADAIADPATGLVATAAVLDALAAGGRWLLDVPMAAVAAHLAGPPLAPAPQTVPAAPHARAHIGRAPRLGEHTQGVLAGLS